MRVLANTETAVRDLLAEKIAKRQVTHTEAVRLYTTGFRNISATIAKWRHRNATNEAIQECIDRRMTAARQHKTQASQILHRCGSRDERAQKVVAKANQELTIAQMYQVIWDGMQRDVAAYQV
jgi:hypothetical protein